MGTEGKLEFQVPTDAPDCAGCRQPFAPDDERELVVLQCPPRTPLEDGTPIAASSVYHKRCSPTDEDLQAHVRELWPSLDADHG